MGGHRHRGKRRLRTPPWPPPAPLQTVHSPGNRGRRSLGSLQPRTGQPAPHPGLCTCAQACQRTRARDPAERGIVLSRDPGAYATERAAKMADDEAEQERLSGGGCAAELRRLGERLQELERRLCESREPAVEAAAAYCRQLCQVSPSPSAGLSGRSAGGPRLCVRRPGWARGASGSVHAAGLAPRAPGWPSRGSPRPPAAARSRPAFVVRLGSDRKVFVDVLEPIPPDLQAGSGGGGGGRLRCGRCRWLLSAVQRSCHRSVDGCPLGAAFPVSVSPLRSGRVGFPAPCTPTPTPHFLGSFLLSVFS